MAGNRLVRTIAAGIGATWIMDRVDKLVYLSQPGDVHRREAQLEDLTGPGSAAVALARTFGRELTHDEAVRWGRMLHVSVGIGAALPYPTLARRWPWIRFGVGGLYGALLSPMNLLVVPALGLTPPTRAFPSATTTRAILYHLGYGFGLDVLTRVLRLDRTK